MYYHVASKATTCTTIENQSKDICWLCKINNASETNHCFIKIYLPIYHEAISFSFLQKMKTILLCLIIIGNKSGNMDFNTDLWDAGNLEKGPQIHQV